MKSFGNKGCRVLMILFAAILVFSATSMGNAVGKDHSVPFKATGNANAVAVGGPTILEIDISGSGHATHMGKTSISQYHFVDLTAPLIFYGGRFVWTAANGDTIEGGYHGTMVPTLAGFEIHGYFTIDGGTGRFENAVGGGIASGMQYPDYTADLRLDGTIAF
jgi:hypothetical protein